MRHPAQQVLSWLEVGLEMQVPQLSQPSRGDNAASLCVLQVRVLYESLLKHQEEQNRVALLEQQVLTVGA